jgi:uncharacterized protein YndB with AHSA1/START domain
MIAKGLIVVIATILAVLVLAAIKPDTLQIQRSITIQAPPEKIFPLINDLHQWSRWQEQFQDSSIKQTFSGSNSGVGAASNWEGSGPAGKGQMLITGSVPFSGISVTVDFTRPFAAHNLNNFALEPDGNSTRVVWNWQGSNAYFMKLMGVFVNMDRMIGKHFETSLANLKTLAERP